MHGSAVAVFAAVLVLGLIVVARLMVVRSRGNITVFILSTGCIIAAGLAPTPIAAQACVKPAKVSHELHICHVAQLGIVLQSLLDALPFDRAHADVLHLAILQQLAVVTVLELNYLVHIRRWRSCTVLLSGIHLMTVPARWGATSLIQA